MPPVLVVHYSCTGTARRAAQELASHGQWAVDHLLRRRPRFHSEGPPPLGRDPIACAGFRQREVDDGSARERLHQFADALDLSADLPAQALDSAWTAPA